MKSKRLKAGILKTAYKIDGHEEDRKKFEQSRSQSSMEFFMLIGLAFLAVILFAAISANEVKELRDQKEFFLIEDLALKLQKEVTIAADAGDGYERKFSLPDKLENIFDYSTTIRNNTITVESLKAVFSLPIENATGNFIKGSNKVDNIDGRVYLNLGATQCNDGMDNDGDLDIDLDDTGCTSKADDDESDECADNDGDGHNDQACGGDDCNDALPNGAFMFPGNPEVCDGLDNDCSGSAEDADFCQATCTTRGFTWTNNGGSLDCCGDDANEDNPYEPLRETIVDGNDNDCNGLIDDVNYALRFFDETNYVWVNAHPSLNINSEITLEAWINPIDVFWIHRVVYRGDSGSNAYTLATTASAGTFWRGYGGVSKPGSSLTVTGGLNPENSGWHHLVFTFNDAANTAKVYIDGNEVGTNTGTGQIGNLAGYGLYIGGEGGFNGFYGLIDEVRIYAKTLPQSLIQQHVMGDYSGDSTGCGGPCDLRAMWHFDEGIGSTTADGSGNGNTGAFVGNPAWVVAPSICPSWC